MTIPVTCEGCGKHHEVDEAHAGRRGKCTRCGRTMTVPDAASAAAPTPEATDAYQLEERPEAAPSTFVRAPAGADSDPTATRGGRSRSAKPPRREDADKLALPDLSTLRRVLPIGLAIAAVVGISLVVLPPAGLMAGGMVFAIAGLILTLYGYGSGAYIAFTEDSLHGMLYLIIPLYTAYYVLSRWDEMRSRLAIVLVGLAFLAVGSKLMETGNARSEPAKAESRRGVPRLLEPSGSSMT